MLNSFVIANPRRCLGCFTCMAACSTSHRQQGLQARPRLQITYTLAGTMPVQCHQCEDAPCALVCPVRAIEAGNGAVRLNEGNCIGCKMCAIVCPFGAIAIGGAPPPSIEAPANPSRPLLAWLAGQKMIAIKCDLCSSGTDGPACVRSCPTKALQLVAGEQVERLGQFKRSNAVTDAASFFSEQGA